MPSSTAGHPMEPLIKSYCPNLQQKKYQFPLGWRQQLLARHFPDHPVTRLFAAKMPAPPTTTMSNVSAYGLLICV